MVGGTVILVRLIGRYVRRYTFWLVLAILTIPLYGLATTAMVSLVEPIFAEVLQAGDAAPAMLASPTAEEDAGDASEKGGLGGLLAKFDLKRLSEEAYSGLKAVLGITDRNVVWFVPVLFVTVFLLRGLMNFISAYSFQRIGLGITRDLRDDVYRKILDQSSAFLSDHSSGELVSRITNDVGLIQMAVTSRVLDLLQQSVTLVFLVGLLLSTNLQLALMCLVGAPVLLLTIVRFGKGMRRTSHRAQERIADVTSLLTEGIRGHRVVKAFGMEDFEDERFQVATERHMKMSLRAQLLDTLSSPVVESLAAVGSAGLLVYAGLKIRSGELTAPVLIQFIANLLLLYDPIRKLNRINLVLQHALAGATRVNEIMSVPIDITDRAGASDISGVEDDLCFEHVGFAYGKTTVLHDVDLEIPRGQMVALVGPSGAGKTTMVNLVPRFFDPVDGRVSIDGRDIRDVTIRTLREQIGIVTQDTVLFNDTIRNNIAYGRADVPLEEVRAAARAAYADDFILEQPEGYDTVIGEAGTHLSGGQRQRLSIARALFKNAPILILDEATSHLDTESEALVQKALNNLMKDRTTLVVAHRLSTVMRADRIVVMEAGRIVQIGTHHQLLERGGLYKRLYDLQFES
jgi:subfamily B ATP-binding cassette protein MsbA